MKCHSCNAEIKDQSKFCIHCGASVTAAAAEAIEKSDPPPAEQTTGNPAPTATVRTAPGPDTEPDGELKGQKTKEQKKPEKKAAAAETQKSRNVPYAALLFSAVLMINVLTYVLCSAVLVTKKTMLSPALLYLLRFAGYAAAAGVLWIGTKITLKKNRIADIVLLLGLIAAERTVSPLLLDHISPLEFKPTVIFAAAYTVAELLIAGLMLIPLKRLFSPKEKCRQGGKILSYFLTVLSLFLPNILDFTVTVVNMDTPSFMQTFAQKTAVSFLMAGFMSLAVRRLLKKQKEEKQAGRFGKIVKLAAGAVCLVSAGAVPAVMNTSDSLPTRVTEDIAGYIIQGRIYLMQGNMTDCSNAFMQAGEHCTAWNTVIEGEYYELPEMYAEDPVLCYLSALNSDTETLAAQIIHSSTYKDVDMYGPMFLDKLADSKRAGRKMESLQKEILSVCAGREIFVNNYPAADELDDYADDIEDAIDPEDVTAAYSVQLRLADAFAAAQTGEISTSSLVDTMLELAENNTRDITCQYMAAMVGSENVWDNAGHLDRTADAALRFISLWESEGKKSVSADTAQNMTVYRQICNMLIRVRHESEAAELLEPLVNEHPDDGETMKLLLNCYLKANDSDKAFTLSEKIHEKYPDDIDVLHDCCIGALQHEDSLTAIQYADELAQLSLKGGNMDPDCDTLLFNCVSYLSFNDSDYWTRFQYAVYDGEEDTEPEVKAALEKNSFLNSYVQMMYNTMEERDYEKALEIADSLTEQADSSAKIWYMKGILYFDLEEFEKSEEALLRADELKPNEGSTMYALANTCDALEKYEECYQLCKRIVALYPDGAFHDEDWYGIVPHAEGLIDRLEDYAEESE